MLSVQMEQRVNLKFRVKLRKTLQKLMPMLKDRDVKRPRTIRAPDSLQRQKRTKTLKKVTYRRLSIRGLAEITKIDKECVRQILHESFNMRKVCSKMVPKLPVSTPEQKQSRMNICADILNNIDTDPGLLDTAITCDYKIRKCGSG
ncbi:hypothetical protein NQ318_002084 [Aromia moschata]|uniref:Uncharacterized protein n=1 Tax=Aromia moschata TaxID=1265417 RepID=A0AAV8Z1R0_9CUCU|nr:hypothetical protein NQ318_002084 [Aromia moschata]